MAEITSQLSTALADRYRIESHLGAGGMATVYLAEDLKHKRKVAVKVLRPELAAVIGGERFLKEIEVTANLQHPNILALYDSGEVDSFLFYVMPYVEGESLRDKLDREKQLGIEDALSIAKAVASALDYAHRHGVVHRDIKPENILLQDGQPVVADFGIALAVSAAGGERITETGLSLGTPHYMSPEQATGDRELDSRSDIYALGCITYEMFTGDPPHTGSTAQAIIASVITEEPRPVTSRRNTAPPHVEAAVHKALAKLPADRFSSAAEYSMALDAAGAVSATAAFPTGPARGSDRRLVGTTAAAVVFALLALWFGTRGPAETDPVPVSRFDLPLPNNLSASFLAGSDFTVSPDGSRIVFAGRYEEGTQLYSRRLGALEIEPIPDTEGASQPFYSPDGQWIGFVADLSILRKVPASGGPAVDVLRFARTGVTGPHWADDDRILFTQAGTLYRVGSSGGAVDTIATPVEQLLYWPFGLPDGRSALVTVGQLAQTSRVGLIDLSTGEVSILVPEGGQAFYSPTGHLLYGHWQSQSLLAAPFDASGREITGDAVPVLQDLLVSSGSNAGNTELVISRGGTLAYFRSQTQGSAGNVITVTDLDGNEEVINPEGMPSGSFTYPRFSPGGGRIVFGASADIYVLERDVGAVSRFTFEGQNFFPTWSPDGQYIAFTSLREGTQDFDVHRRGADGRGLAEKLTDRSFAQGPRIWMDDGSLIVVEVHPSRQYDLHLMDSAGAMAPLLTGVWNESAPAMSPDGRWLAFVSDETGRQEVYITAFPEGGNQWQVSQDGGSDPLWGDDGTIFFIHEADLHVARIRTEPSVTVLDRQLALEGPFMSGARSTSYDRDPVSGRFVFVKTATTGLLPTITVVTNWFDELRERVTR